MFLYGSFNVLQCSFGSSVRTGKQQRESGVYAVEETTQFRNLDKMAGTTLEPDMDTKAINKEMALISNALAAYSFIAGEFNLCSKGSISTVSISLQVLLGLLQCSAEIQNLDYLIIPYSKMWE